MARYQPVSVVIEAGSIAWGVNRMIADAVKVGRLSDTEAALVYDFVCHSKMPNRFRVSPHEGGARREERF